ncbi:HD domain-containing protein [Antarcticibacterium sp. 1MA-6-2]|uniref:HD domain-containing protein n=1 Tax=Antarcticibacterium sp. 1MA-6-2 TaxID=2908210 RepID=UPI001F486A4C|nr:HD domain-containing protein [Antarcticibacterium sp. 1MA-6-2]UJH90316.1 HD domain-containing protein [Antarcticibacterium sp. 1MA-6-2]
MTNRFPIGTSPNHSPLTQDQIIQKTKIFVEASLKDAEGGHDYFHIERVLNNALLINREEGANEFIVVLGALLHDIADYKFHNGDETVGPKTARNFLSEQGVDQYTIDQVVKIIENVSFKGGNERQEFCSKELEIIQDADRLDALGAIGIARTFNYGGFKGRALYDPGVKPNLSLTKEEYKASTAPTINHFYEKLLLLKDRMNTKTGRTLAAERHRFMEQFLDHFYAEWEGKR